MPVDSSHRNACDSVHPLRARPTTTFPSRLVSFASAEKRVTRQRVRERPERSPLRAALPDGRLPEACIDRLSDDHLAVTAHLRREQTAGVKNTGRRHPVEAPASAETADNDRAARADARRLRAGPQIELYRYCFVAGFAGPRRGQQQQRQQQHSSTPHEWTPHRTTRTTGGFHGLTRAPLKQELCAAPMWDDGVCFCRFSSMGNPAWP